MFHKYVYSLLTHLKHFLFFRQYLLIKTWFTIHILGVSYRRLKGALSYVSDNKEMIILIKDILWWLNYPNARINHDHNKKPQL